MRVSWILMPGYRVAPTVMRSASRWSRGKSLRLEGGEAVGDLEELLAHGGQMVKA